MKPPLCISPLFFASRRILSIDYLSYEIVYRYVTDYQGNNISVVDEDGTVVQRTNYYPYGEPWKKPEGQPFLYSDKERFRWEGIRDYDFDARRYWASMCMFTTPDPLAEATPWVSPYVYCLANPMRYIDRNGQYPKEIIQFHHGYGVPDYYTFTRPAVHLLHLVSGVPK